MKFPSAVSHDYELLLKGSVIPRVMERVRKHWPQVAKLLEQNHQLHEGLSSEAVTDESAPRLDLDLSKEIQKVLEGMKLDVTTQAISNAEADRMAKSFVGLVNQRVNQDLSALTKRKFMQGIDVLGLSTATGRELTQSTLSAAVGTNVSLIRDLPVRGQKKVTDIVMKGFASGESTKAIEAQLSGVEELLGKDIERIAVDQTGKIYGDVNKIRQTDAGLKTYVWSDAGDGRVRNKHKALDGRVFTWEKGALNGLHPGRDYRCRCVAEPNPDEIADFGRSKDGKKVPIPGGKKRKKKPVPQKGTLVNELEAMGFSPAFPDSLQGRKDTQLFLEVLRDLKKQGYSNTDKDVIFKLFQPEKAVEQWGFYYNDGKTRMLSLSLGRAQRESAKAMFKSEVHEIATNNRWWNASSKLDKNSVDHMRSILRHEMGHHITHDPQIKMAWRDAIIELAGPDEDKIRTWVQRNIGHYAATNDNECMAEAFSLFTHPRYKKGMLPDSLEDILRKAKTPKKAKKKPTLDFQKMYIQGDLTKAQEKTLRHWVVDGQDMRKTYRGLRVETDNARRALLKEQLDELEKLMDNSPEFEGTVWRGWDDLPEDVFQKLYNSDVFELDAPTSSTLNLEVADRFIDEHSPTSIIMEMKTKHGTRIPDFDPGPHTLNQEEILLRPGAKYRVVERGHKELWGQQVPYLKVEEVTDTSNYMSFAKKPPAEWAASLSDDEQAVIRAWSRNDYREIRRWQAKGIRPGVKPHIAGKTWEIEEVSDMLEAAVDRCEPWKGKVYRGIGTDDPKMLQRLTNGKVLEWDALTSASKSRMDGIEFTSQWGLKKRQILFEIDQVSGVDINPGLKGLTALDEAEVLMKRGVKYQVVGKPKKETIYVPKLQRHDDIWVVKLKELPADSPMGQRSWVSTLDARERGALRRIQEGRVVPDDMKDAYEAAIKRAPTFEGDVNEVVLLSKKKLARLEAADFIDIDQPKGGIIRSVDIGDLPSGDANHKAAIIRYQTKSGIDLGTGDTDAIIRKGGRYQLVEVNQKKFKKRQVAEFVFREVDPSDPAVGAKKAARQKLATATTPSPTGTKPPMTFHEAIATPPKAKVKSSQAAVKRNFKDYMDNQGGKQWKESLDKPHQDAVKGWLSDTRGDGTRGIGYMEIRSLQKGRLTDVSDEVVEKTKKALRQLDEALESAPRHEGTVYRGLQIDQKRYDDLIRQTAVEFDAHASTTPDDFMGFKFATERSIQDLDREMSVVMEIRGVEGAKVGWYAKLGETEVVLPKGTRLRRVGEPIIETYKPRNGVSSKTITRLVFEPVADEVEWKKLTAMKSPMDSKTQLASARYRYINAQDTLERLEPQRPRSLKALEEARAAEPGSWHAKQLERYELHLKQIDEAIARARKDVATADDDIKRILKTWDPGTPPAVREAVEEAVERVVTTTPKPAPAIEVIPENPKLTALRKKLSSAEEALEASTDPDEQKKLKRRIRKYKREIAAEQPASPVTSAPSTPAPKPQPQVTPTETPTIIAENPKVTALKAKIAEAEEIAGSIADPDEKKKIKRKIRKYKRDLKALEEVPDTPAVTTPGKLKLGKTIEELEGQLETFTDPDDQKKIKRKLRKLKRETPSVPTPKPAPVVTSPTPAPAPGPFKLGTTIEELEQQLKDYTDPEQQKKIKRKLRKLKRAGGTATPTKKPTVTQAPEAPKPTARREDLQCKLESVKDGDLLWGEEEAIDSAWNYTGVQTQVKQKLTEDVRGGINPPGSLRKVTDRVTFRDMQLPKKKFDVEMVQAQVDDMARVMDQLDPDYVPTKKMRGIRFRNEIQDDGIYQGTWGRYTYTMKQGDWMGPKVPKEMALTASHKPYQTGLMRSKKHLKVGRSPATRSFVRDHACSGLDGTYAEIGASTARHELGHHIWFSMSPGKQQEFRRIFRKLEDERKVNSVLGYYGGTNVEEGFAEAFSLFTHKRYRRGGALGAELEACMGRLFRR